MNTQPNQYNNAGALHNEEIDLSALLYELWNHKWIIFTTIAFSLVIGIWINVKQIPQYQSELLLQIEPGQSRFSANENAAQLFLGNSKNDTVSTQMALIKSPFILVPVIKSLGLDIFSVPETSFWKKFFSRSLNENISISKFEVPDRYIDSFFHVKMRSSKKYTLYDSGWHKIFDGRIGFLNRSPQGFFKLKINSILGSEKSVFTIMKKSDIGIASLLAKQIKIEEIGEKGRQNTGILSLSITGEAPVMLMRILNAVANTTQQKDASKKAQEAYQTLSFLNQQLPITKALLERAEQDLNHYRAKSGKIDLKLQAEFLLRQLSEIDKKLDELRMNRIDMEQQYTKIHPANLLIKNQMGILKKQRVILNNELKRLPEADQIAVNLLRDVKVKKTLYLLLLNKIQELQVIKAGTISSVRILSLAKAPKVPLPSKKLAIYIASMLIGTLSSFLIIFVRKLWLPKITDPLWCEKHFNLTNLAIIPYCKEQKDASILMDHSKQLPLLAHANPRNITIESLRSLRTNLQISLPSAQNNIIAILGISPGVGKSFVSSNLAYLLAMTGKRVLLIDADLRRGTLHKYMNVASSPGLSEILNSTKSIDDLKITTNHDNLFFIPRGEYPKDPAELLSSLNCKQIMDDLRKKFDIVVIDTAPVLLVTDAVVLSSYTGTNYLVLGASAHQPLEIEMSIKRLHSAGTHIHGSIYNFHRSKAKKPAYGKYSSYQYQYYYDESMKI